MERLPRTIEMIKDAQGWRLSFIDQRKLPAELKIVRTDSWEMAVDAIKTLAVRGAPAIGIAGAGAMALWVADYASRDLPRDGFIVELEGARTAISSARPTAVNLAWAVERMGSFIVSSFEQGESLQAIAENACALVVDLIEEDIARNRAIGRNGADLIPKDATLLTHCNAGSLATAFFGTALGVIYEAAEQGKVDRVYADETRPVGQGARLTVWELSRAGIPVTLICDSMAASLMAQGSVDAVIVGADRIASNGDTANKIGTYGLAIAAREHGVPFYVAAPTSTIDPSIADGSQVIIEEREASEVMATPIDGVEVWNPAFDVTPARLITAIITEKGVFEPARISDSI